MWWSTVSVFLVPISSVYDDASDANLLMLLWYNTQRLCAGKIFEQLTGALALTRTRRYRTSTGSTQMHEPGTEHKHATVTVHSMRTDRAYTTANCMLHYYLTFDCDQAPQKHLASSTTNRPQSWPMQMYINTVWHDIPVLTRLSDYPFEKPGKEFSGNLKVVGKSWKMCCYLWCDGQNKHNFLYF